jgi:hypothetical protein
LGGFLSVHPLRNEVFANGAAARKDAVLEINFLREIFFIMIFSLYIISKKKRSKKANHGNKNAYRTDEIFDH